jgi:succinate dehydrogenase / fumarate reductase cytochrome b subunit
MEAMHHNPSCFDLQCSKDRFRSVLAKDARRTLMSETKRTARPLSPHLQVYRPMLTMMMSIIHRITGATLYFGILLLIWWLVAAARSDQAFDLVQAFFGHWFGKIVLIGFSWALIHHFLGGLRHLLWDTGRGFDLKTIEWLARGNLLGSIALTILLWIIVYGVKP